MYGAVGQVPGKLKADVFQKSSASSSHALHSRFAFQLLNFSIVSAYPLALNIISDCWILFAVIWLVAAFWTKRSVYQESRWQRLGYVIPILVGGYLVFKGHRLSDSLDLRVIPHVDALATLAPNAKHIIATKSGHYIQGQEPQLVTDAIKQVVEAVRNRSARTPPLIGR